MNKEILLVAETVSNEKGVPKDVIFEAIESALEVATKKKATQEIEVRVAIDRRTGESESFRQWMVMADDEEIENPDAQVSLKQAHDSDESLEPGSMIEEPIESVGFGRISAQAAKHIIIQKVREAERAQVAEEYQEKIGSLQSGVVRKTTRDFVIIDLGRNAEGFIPRSEMLPGEKPRVGDRIRAYLTEVTPDGKGPQIFLSRKHEGMLIELFRIEVPEVGEEVIEIRAAARDAGSRAKIAVKTNDGRIDPVGACVGMRGSRVQTVSGELNGERVDIILWDDSAVQLVINAMAPAEVAAIEVDEDKHSMDIAVEDSQLSQAIGRNGQNINLASQLTGWTLNVMSVEDAEKKNDAETEGFVSHFMKELSVEEDIAVALVEEGFSSVEELAYLSAEDLEDVESLDQDSILALRDKAKDLLLTKAIAKEEELGDCAPAEDLLALETMDDGLARQLASHGVITREDLAEQSIDDLLDVIEIDEVRAGELIMIARKIWFEEDSNA